MLEEAHAGVEGGEGPGCDGIQSAMRQFVNTGEIVAESSSSAIYSGLRITFAIQEDAGTGEGGDVPEVCQFNQFFGNGAYALT